MVSGTETPNPAFAEVDLQTAELEMTSSIYEGFSTAIVVKGQPRTVALCREFGDAVQIMAAVWQARTAHHHLLALTRSIPAVRRPESASQFLGASCAMMAAYDAARTYLETRSAPAPEGRRAEPTPAAPAKMDSEAGNVDRDDHLRVLRTLLVDPVSVNPGSRAHAALEWAITALQAATPEAKGAEGGGRSGWIVGNGSDTRWRSWDQGCSIWVDAPEKATRYARREDAEIVHAEDEDAWCIKPYPASDSTDEDKLRTALKHYACSCEPGSCAMSCDDTDQPVYDALCGRIAADALAENQPPCTVDDDVEADCPVCAEPLTPSDLCLSDIDLGICHAACLEGSPVVNLETGEPLPADAPAPTPYRYGDI